MWIALSLAGQLGFMIALPIAIMALAGRYADIRFGTSPLFLLCGVLLAATTSSIWVYRSLQRLKRVYEEHS